MPEITIHNPDALGKPLGQYSQITRVKASEFLFIAGQVATDRDQERKEDCHLVSRSRRSYPFAAHLNRKDTGKSTILLNRYTSAAYLKFLHHERRIRSRNFK